MSGPRVSLGIETLVDEQPRLLAGRRVGLLCHAASVDGRLVHTAERLTAVGADLRCLLGPEHGAGGEAQDMVAVGGERDPTRELPVYTLYGDTAESLRPQPGWLKGLDAVVVDLQDVGTRYYTYVWTMKLTLEVCAQVGVRAVVLDRPNPIGGEAIEGPEIDAGYLSFVGLHSLPVRHGMTVGELARLLVSELALDLELTVVPLRGWRRAQYFEQTGLPWVMPSPNMPTVDTALVYPGGCLLEGTNVSEGRGCTRPFEVCGAPWIDGDALCRELARDDLPGVLLRPLSFQPTFHKYAGQRCGGLQLHVVDRRTFRPLLTGVALLAAARRLWPSAFAWRTEPYEFVSDRPAIDLLGGGPRLREGIEAGASLAELSADWAAAQRCFAERRAAHLLYD